MACTQWPVLLVLLAVHAAGQLGSAAAVAAKPSHCREDLPGCCPKEVKHVVLLHIEKTGGTSLRQYLQGSLRKYFNTRSQVICNYLKQMPYQCEPSSAEGGNATCNHRNYGYYRTQIASGQHFRKSCKLTSSHHDYRVVDTMPPDVLATTMLITNFREPASRLASHYHMLRRHEDSRALNMSMEAYLTQDPEGLAMGRNRMTRVLAGEFCCKGGAPVDYSSPKAYARALANLDNFCVVGLTSNVQETFMYIEHVLGMTSGSPPKNIHYHNNSKKYGPVPEEVLARLQEFNQHDTSLFGAASKRFDEQMRVIGVAQNGTGSATNA